MADFQPHMFNGATEKELFALEEKLGLTLPSDFKVFYQTYNGQDDCADDLFEEAVFLRGELPRGLTRECYGLGRHGVPAARLQRG